MLATFRGRLQLLNLLGTLGRRALTALLVVHGLTALTPAASALVTGRLIGSLTAGPDDALQRQLPQLAGALALFAAVLLLTQLVESLKLLVEEDLAKRVDGWVRSRTRQLVAERATLSDLERSEVQDRLSGASDLARRGGVVRSPGTAAVAQAVILSRFLAAVLAAAVLATFSVGLAIGLLALAILMRAVVRRHYLRLSAAASGLEVERRRAEVWTTIGTTAEASKEIRIFGLPGWISGLQQVFITKWIDARQQAGRRLRRWQWPVGVLGFVGVVLALLVPAMAAADGQISAAQLAAYLTAVWGVLDLSGIGAQPFQIEYGSQAIRALRWLEKSLPNARPAPLRSRQTPFGRPEPPPRIQFQDVGFRYPGQEAYVLRGFNLEIAPGEILGVVGGNGEGKTTMIKLLAGLYLPSEGRILVDGEPLQPEHLHEWRTKLSVIFQDYIKYPLTVRENVLLSAPEAGVDGVRVERALDAAGATGVVAGLPNGLNTVLWRGVESGSDVSGGQWQRIALARASYAVGAGRQVLVMDEPTAQLDVESEAEFYDDVVARHRGCTILLISHRFSTIRHADRIVVIKGGRVTESGSHQELLEQGADYARLFAVQARPFRK